VQSQIENETATAARPYVANRYHRDLESEVSRLQRLSQLNWQKEARALSSFGLGDGISLLEVGSGPGFFTQLLSTLVPNGEIIGVEIDPQLIAAAEAYLASRAQSKYRFINRSVVDTKLPDSSVDFAVARLIFQHLPDQGTALREIYRLLKPGGRLVIIDTDYRFSHLTDPVVKEAELALEKAAAVHSMRGGDPRAGRRLWRLLQAGGFQNLDLEAVVLHSGEKGVQWCASQFDPDRLRPLVAAGVIPEEQWRQVREAVDDFLARDDAFYMSIMILACGQKPPSA
jgi:ubiquinone/menaquinone biosynthesis C-methylase UbiE